MAEERRLPLAYYNWLSMIGAYISTVAFLFVLLFLGISFFFEFAANPYLGIVQFLILPMILIFGLILIPVGAYFRRRKIGKGIGIERRQWPRIDFNQKSHRNTAVIFVIGSVLVIFVSAVGSYQTFHYTESVDFCGKVCHEVMNPEYVAYQNSPHARVSCAACHIGTGAGWWVKSKLAGAYQVYAVLANNYPKPIPTPIANLRPAQETCEKCHWPEKFFGAQQKRFNHFMYNEENTPWPIDVLIRTGGGDLQTGQAQGIHWHMNIQNTVEYIARDFERQDIPWVRMTDRINGRIVVFQNQDNPLTEEELAAAEIRTMDCMDCHNRPSHIYNSPDDAIDLALLAGKIDRTLPSIKEVAVSAMAGDYQDQDEAWHAIASEISDFYEIEHPEINASKKEQILEAIDATQTAYSQNIFPSMKVNWTEYPGNLGHFDAPGCMRCHVESMIGEKGQKMTTHCKTCHSILSQGSGDRLEMASSAEGLDFKHPEDIDEAWMEMGCYECHAGVQP